MPYSPLLVRPLKEELTKVGFRDLQTAAEVDAAMKEAASGLTLVVVNAADGEAARVARPAARKIVENASPRFDLLLTVFAGHDEEATAQMLVGYTDDILKEGPAFAVFKDGELLYAMPRYYMSDRSAEWAVTEVTERLQKALG
ncbi:BrxA/BrxB family bacilliredoxin [Kitasatospora sp. NPDC089509]|uniref:BrxA/BrxB family bacilliredoxin n=1 Tax=Kitasatospora sp. NPDC089509 TaxID=3364079 RepID=UPI00381487B3